MDGQSIERFAAQAERCLRELHDGLTDGSYRANPSPPDTEDQGPDRTDGFDMVIEPVFEVQFRPGSCETPPPGSGSLRRRTVLIRPHA